LVKIEAKLGKKSLKETIEIQFSEKIDISIFSVVTSVFYAIYSIILK